MVTTAGLFVPIVADDTEVASWIVRGDRQFWAASILANALDAYAQLHHRPWYVASMLPILYRRPGERRVRQVAPDLFVALAPRHPRESYDLAVEGVFPAFVLEVLSPSSTLRDRDDKRTLYEALGAREYLLFAPDPACRRRRCRATGVARRAALTRCSPTSRDTSGAKPWSYGWRPKDRWCGRCRLTDSPC